MNALGKWWEELDAEDRLLVIGLGAFWLFIMCLINPAVPILVVFFAGMRFTLHEDRRREYDIYDEMLEEYRQRRRQP